MRKAAIIAAGLVVGLAGRAHADLITNGGFETGDFTGWTVNAEFTGVIPSGITGFLPHSGTYFAFLGDVSGSYPYGTLSQTISDSPGQALTLTYWLASDGSQPNYFDATWDGVTLSGSAVSNSSEFPYTLYTFHVVGTGSDTLLFHEQNVPGHSLLDDVSLVPSSGAVPEPFSMALLGSGLVALGFVRRRAP